MPDFKVEKKRIGLSCGSTIPHHKTFACNATKAKVKVTIRIGIDLVTWLCMPQVT
jgi:hypothetical protein